MTEKVSRRKWIGIAGGAVVGLAVGAAAGYVAAPTKTITETFTTTKGQTITQTATTTATVTKAASSFPDELVTAAKKEGALTYYTTEYLDAINAIFASFTQKFPGITTNYYRAGGVEMLQKITAEFQGGQYLADVIELSSPTMPLSLLTPTNYLMDYVPTGTETVKVTNPPYFYAHLSAAIAPVWNTKKVTDAEAPKKWWDIADSKWKNRIGIIEPLGGSIWIPNYMWRYTLEADYGVKFWQAIKANNPIFFQSGTASINSLASGEIDLLVHGVEQSIVPTYFQGYPIKWRFMDPTPITTEVVMISKNTKHPNTAKLFMNWIFSPEGQIKESLTQGTLPTRSDVPDVRPIARESWYQVPVNTWSPTDWNAYNNQIQPMRDEWNKVFKG